MRTEGPLYHMHEMTGRMTQIVLAFLEHRQLSDADFHTLRSYVFQWVAAMPKKPDDYEHILTMNQDRLMEYYTRTLLDWGIDPF